MRSRLFLIILLLSFMACSNPNKKTESTPETATANEVKGDDRVIINPQSEVDTLKGSLKAYAEGKIGNTNIAINYYSPATRGRMIWGGLVAYDNVWVTGAHKATSIEFDRDIKMGGTVVKAGKYAFFTIPGKDQWTVILNKNWNQHLADDYAQTDDVVRLIVTPESEKTHQERLRYVIEAEGENAGEIVTYWEKLEISVPFEIIQ